MIFSRIYADQPLRLSTNQEEVNIKAPEVSWTSGVLDAVGTGVMSAYYETLSAVQGIASAMGLGDEEYQKKLDLLAYRNRQISREEYQPDPVTSSKAAQIVHGASNGLTKFGASLAVGSAVPMAAAAAGVTVPAAVGTAVTSAVFGTQVGVTTAQNLKDEGVDEETAAKAGAFSGVANTFWSFIPGAFGVNAVTRIGSGAGLSTFATVNESAVIRSILENADYSKAAEKYDPTNPLDLAAAAVMGAGAGAMVHVTSRRPGTEYITNGGRGPQVPDVDVEDAARLRAQEIANDGNLPVDPANGVQVQKAREAQQTADRQFRRKERIQVAADSADPQRIEEIRKATLERLAEQKKTGGVLLQNRDRSSKESIAQMNAIAANPDYLRVSTSHQLAEGAPVATDAFSIPEVQRGRREVIVDAKGQRYQAQYAVVDADEVLTSNAVDGTPNLLYGAVEDNSVAKAVAGNGRITALNEAYARGTADRYKQELAADSANHGISADVIEHMQRPILVRLVKAEDLPADIGDRSNTRTTADLNYIETAINDSTRVDLSRLTFTEDGNVSPTSVAEFVALLPEAERGQLIVNGVPTDLAYQRLDRAIFQAAYGDPGLTAMLDGSGATPGVSQLLRALRILAPRVLGLDGYSEVDFRPYLAEVMNEFRMVRANGQKVRLSELAAQTSMTRTAEAQAFLDFLARNEAEGGGSAAIAKVFSDLADFAKENIWSVEQGPGLFGENPRATRLDLMHEFGRLTGMEINDRAFMPARTLNDAVKAGRHERMKSSGRIIQQAANALAGERPMQAPANIGLVEIGRGSNGEIFRALAVNGNPNLTELPPGIPGVQALPVRLQEGTLAGGHIRKHLAELKKAGYESVEQAVLDVSRNWRWITKGSRAGGIRLVRPLMTRNGDRFDRSMILAELQKDGNAYRIGSVYFSSRAPRGSERAVLFDREPSGRGPLSPDSSRPQGWRPPATDQLGNNTSPDINVGRQDADVNRVLSAVEKVEEAKNAAVVRRSLELVRDERQISGDKRAALAAIEQDPSMRIQLDGEDASVNAAEFIAGEEARARELEQTAESGVTAAVECALTNGGI